MADKIAGIDAHKKVLMVVVVDARAPESLEEVIFDGVGHLYVSQRQEKSTGVRGELGKRALIDQDGRIASVGSRPMVDGCG